jgi:serine/threonine protein kinase
VCRRFWVHTNVEWRQSCSNNDWNSVFCSSVLYAVLFIQSVSIPWSFEPRRVSFSLTFFITPLSISLYLFILFLLRDEYASDVWALGICMFQLCTGTLPFKAQSWGNLLVVGYKICVYGEDDFTFYFFFFYFLAIIFFIYRKWTLTMCRASPTTAALCISATSSSPF